MVADELILQALRNSTLAEELRDSEIEMLGSLITVREYKAGDTILKPGDAERKDSLLIVGSGDVSISFPNGTDQTTLNQLQSGAIAGVIGFVGGNVAQISATVVAQSDCKILILQRARFETLLNSQPAIAYYVMRGIVRHVHGIVRRMNTQSVELNNYIYQTHGRY
jgi:CRP-like cAMP-binding protein